MLVRTAVVICLVLAVTGAPAPAGAARLELVGEVPAPDTALCQRPVGAARYLAISDLAYRDRQASLQVLDLETRDVITVRVPRAPFERRFGKLARGDVAMYRPGVVGLAVSETAVASGAPRRQWYAELDARTGAVVRSTDLGTVYAGGYLQIVGVDTAAGAAWFAIARAAGRGRELVLRRLDLDTLTTADVHRVALAPRRAGYEHAARVHAAPDFAQFAVVEYFEDGKGVPPGKVYVVDARGGSAFSVPAPSTAYGVAFAPDGRYLYLGSAQRGTISRVDLAARAIDKRVAAPRYLHHLVVAADGTLLALASSSRYASYALPDLAPRADHSHPPGLAPAMARLFGNGAASIDGAYFVVPGPKRSYVIARLVAGAAVTSRPGPARAAAAAPRRPRR